MKHINLTTEQELKLIEMSKVLFPEYKEILYGSATGLIKFITKVGSIAGIVHWFEFCMTKLTEKIIATYIVNRDGDKVYKRNMHSDLSTFYLSFLPFSRLYESTHPIDYLYKKFKELENEKIRDSI